MSLSLCPLYSAYNVRIYVYTVEVKSAGVSHVTSVCFPFFLTRAPRKNHSCSSSDISIYIYIYIYVSSKTCALYRQYSGEFLCHTFQFSSMATKSYTYNTTQTLSTKLINKTKRHLLWCVHSASEERGLYTYYITTARARAPIRAYTWRERMDMYICTYVKHSRKPLHNSCAALLALHSRGLLSERERERERLRARRATLFPQALATSSATWRWSCRYEREENRWVGGYIEGESFRAGYCAAAMIVVLKVRWVYYI